MTRNQLNLTLTVVAVGLLGAAYFSQHQKQAKPETLTGLTPDAITRITLEHPGKPTIELKRGDKDKDWSLTAPVTVAADPLQVAQLLDVASEPIKQTLTAQDLNKAALGLDPPGFSVRLNDQTIQFGGVETLSYERYVETGGKIVLIDDPAPPPLDADYSDLVAKSLVPTSTVINAIEIPGLSVKLSSDGKNWQAAPASDAATPASLEAFVDDWHSARAQFIQLAATPGSGDPVTITSDGGQSIALVIVAREPKLIFERPDLHIRYVMDRTQANKLLKLLPPPPPPSSPAAPAAPPGPAMPAVLPTSPASPAKP